VPNPRAPLRIARRDPVEYRCIEVIDANHARESHLDEHDLQLPVLDSENGRNGALGVSTTVMETFDRAIDSGISRVRLTLAHIA
jgi:hypothetical protein